MPCILSPQRPHLGVEQGSLLVHLGLYVEELLPPRAGAKGRERNPSLPQDFGVWHACVVGDQPVGVAALTAPIAVVPILVEVKGRVGVRAVRAANLVGPRPTDTEFAQRLLSGQDLAPGSGHPSHSLRVGGQAQFSWQGRADTTDPRA